MSHQNSFRRAPLRFGACIALVVSLSGCDNKTDGAAGSASAAADSTAKSNGSAAQSGSAGHPAASLPKEVDEAVVAELKKVGPCEREEGYRKDGCAAADAWDKYKDKLLEEDDLNLTKGKKLTRACFSLVSDENPNIREVAYDCLSQSSDAVEDPKAVISYVLSKIESETVEIVRSAMLSALDDLDPPKNGGTAEVLALAKKLAPRDDASSSVGKLLDALTPGSKDNEPSDESFAYAVELLGKKQHQSDAAELIASARSKSKEGCVALLGLIETKTHPWSTGINAMALLGDACKEQYDKVIAVVVEKAGEGEGYNKGFGTSDAFYLGRLVEKGGLTPEQKTKLRAAIEPLVKNAKDENIKKSYQTLVDKLK